MFLYFFQTEEQEVITFLLTTEIIPLCLRIMETGFELTKTLSTFILQKILMDDNGLSYICQTYDRFSHVALILVSIFSTISTKIFNIFSFDFQGKMVLALEREPSTRLLRHVVGCYVRLSENSRYTNNYIYFLIINRWINLIKIITGT